MDMTMVEIGKINCDEGNEVIIFGTQSRANIIEKDAEPIENNYLSKFNIYCLINSGKKDEAQLIFDLKKELGFNDQYFENKLNYLFGYTNEIYKTDMINMLIEIVNKNY